MKRVMYFFLALTLIFALTGCEGGGGEGTEAEIESRTEAGTEAEIESRTEAGTGAGTGAGSGIGAETEAGTGAGTKSGIEAETEAEIESGTEAGTDAETGAEIDAEIEAGTEAGAGIGAETEAGTGSGIGSGTDGPGAAVESAGAWLSEGTEEIQDEPERPDGSGFEVHYIDVGQADSALVLCDGEAMLIDGGNVEDSSLIYTCLKNLSLDHLKYVVCTHAHEDHVGGLAGALNYAMADAALCPVTSYDSEAFDHFLSCLDEQGVSITVPKAGDHFSLGSASVEVLGPVNTEEEEPNNTSIVLRIVYGGTSFLFTGDAEREEEQEILGTGRTLASTVLKVGHHGSENSTTYPFLREIMPEYAVISVGAGNSYGHPAEETLSRLRDADVKVYRTDLQGDVVCTSDGSTVSFSVERNADADTLGGIGENSLSRSGGADPSVPSSDPVRPDGDGGAPEGTEYVLNTNTHKFHYPTCASVGKMKESNRSYFTGTREEVIAMGYEPCGNCKP